MNGWGINLVGEAEGHTGESFMATFVRKASQEGQVGIESHHVVCMRVHKGHLQACLPDILVILLQCARHLPTLLFPPSNRRGQDLLLTKR